MIEVQKKTPNEPSRSLIQRFSRMVRSSGVLRQAKKARFRDRPLNRTRRRTAALVREQRRKKKEWMRKRGLLK